MRLAGAISVLACGCISTRVDGTIAGAAVPVESATFAEVPGVWGDDGAILVWLLPVPDACDTLTKWLSVSESSRDPGELTDAWNQNFPASFWQVDVVLRLVDPHASQSGEWLTGADFNAEAGAAGIAYAEVVRSNRARDEAYFSGVVADPGDYLQRWYSHKGLLQIHKHRPGETLTGVFTTEAAEPEAGARQGEVVIRFDADHCAAVEGILTR